jgi:hypothetical protein
VQAGDAERGRPRPGAALRVPPLRWAQPREGRPPHGRVGVLVDQPVADPALQAVRLGDGASRALEATPLWQSARAR